MSERLLPLEGGRNFRDMGGYRTDDGRMTRWGRLFRSGAMSDLTEADHRFLAGLGIAVICDFRTVGERVDEPTLWPGEAGPPIRTRDYEINGRRIRDAVAAGGGFTQEIVREAMKGFYVELPYGHLESYQMMFSELLAGNVPLVINCSAGKDRTGAAAALLLSALDVRWDEILHDYSLSEKLVDFEAVATRVGATDRSTGFAAVAKMSRELRSSMLRSDPAYLTAMRDEIERREGSIANYLRSHLDIGPSEKKALQAMLLEPA
ncbi:MAG: tyrosine-protein phosphatase [Caulobacteraceae bacterium]|nr:tyrosine-protein phosphatase [Caulobacteraceae bacterium]